MAFADMIFAIIAVTFGGNIILCLIKSQERVRVLKRIVTDKNERLKNNIDAL